MTAIPVDLPSIPDAVPAEGPIIPLPGLGARVQWSDVFNWIQNNWTSAIPGYGGTNTLADQAIVRIAKAWTGTHLQANASYINQAFDFADAIGSALSDVVSTATTFLGFGIDNLQTALDALTGTVYGIEHGTITNIERLLGDLANAIPATAAGVVHLVQTWAIDNIRDPLTAEIERTRADLLGVIEGTATGTLTIAQDLIDQANAQTLVKVGAVAAAVTAVEAWVADCGEPMCQLQGPKTDLGKLFKALQVAVDAAAIADLLALTEPELVQRLTDAVGHVASLVSDFEGYFTDHTKTLGSILNPLG